MSIQRVLCSCGVLLLFASSQLLADVVVLDDNFSSGEDYTIGSFTNADPPFENPADLSYVDFEIIESGGNPGDALSLMHFHDVDRDESGAPIDGNGETSVFSFLRNNDVEYNPFSEGAISSVTYSFEYMTSDSDITSVLTHMRNGAGTGNFAGTEAVIADGTWRSYSQTFTNPDFFLMDFSGATNLSLQFGFGFASTRDVTDDTEEIMMNVLVDNFSVSVSAVSAVPEPSSLWTFGIVGISVAGLRRRRLRA